MYERKYEKEALKWEYERKKWALINNNVSDTGTDTKKSQLEEQEKICNDIKEQMKEINNNINNIYNEIGIQNPEEQKNTVI